ncbi:MAG: CAP domain-containing protein [Candidatus Hydrogenedentales bacterium]|jgi:uncharacterized protein YkwD
MKKTIIIIMLLACSLNLSGCNVLFYMLANGCIPGVDLGEGEGEWSHSEGEWSQGEGEWSEGEAWDGDDPAKCSLYGYEIQLFNLINQERVKAGVAELKYFCRAAKVAEGHSRDMAEHNFFSHENLSNHDAGVRLRAAGIAWKRYAENIGRDFPIDQLERLVQKWMASSGHRANILSPRYTYTGIGIAQNKEGQYYYTQVFLAL